jgi:hypothetical protein
MFVKPAPGRLVRLPDHPYSFIPADGMNVPDSPYIRRRLVWGSLVLCETPAESVKVAKTKPATEETR